MKKYTTLSSVEINSDAPYEIKHRSILILTPNLLMLRYDKKPTPKRHATDKAIQLTIPIWYPCTVSHFTATIDEKVERLVQIDIKAENIIGCFSDEISLLILQRI